ncbi:MAG: ABC transporter ATP-binding protein [Acidobacteria bacterium]|nr:MAG: ABC transporter ATP-binding protein [Acidobacteriota bacterium]
MLAVRGLVKRFGSLEAVAGVSFEVADGEIFGLLGPNGAGKTTTISMIAGVLAPDAGEILVDGRDVWSRPAEVKRALGVVPQEIALYEDLTARDNLAFWASLYGLRGRSRREAVERSLERVGLSGRGGDRVRTFSGGMKRRLNLAMGLVHEPRLLLLDEPTVGIDPQARAAILDIVREIAAGGTTVLYTTHYMDEAEKLCRRIAIIDHGKILAAGTLDELTRLAGESNVLRVTGRFRAEELHARLQRLEGLEPRRVDDGLAILAIDRDGPGLPRLLPALVGSETGIEDIAIQRPTLETVFLTLTGRELRD